MKIALVVYSYTGHTLNIAQLLQTKLLKEGQDVTLISLKATDENPNARVITLVDIPDLSVYDEIILGSPVRGFQVSPIIKAFLEKTSSFNQKKVMCYVTHAFPYAWMGGKSAINMMKDLILKKDGLVSSTGIIDHSGKPSEAQIQDLLQRFSEV
jgi:flavodoxin